MNRANIFETLGRVSVLFSTLEAKMAELLWVLINREEPSLAATVLERTSFARTLELLEKVAQFKSERLEARISRLVAAARPLRQKRNLFVHGSWNISQKLLNEGKVAVSDSKVLYEAGANSRSWRKGAERILKCEELSEYQIEVMRALHLADELLQSLETETT